MKNYYQPNANLWLYEENSEMDKEERIMELSKRMIMPYLEDIIKDQYLNKYICHLSFDDECNILFNVFGVKLPIYFCKALENMRRYFLWLNMSENDEHSSDDLKIRKAEDIAKIDNRKDLKRYLPEILEEQKNDKYAYVLSFTEKANILIVSGQSKIYYPGFLPTKTNTQLCDQIASRLRLIVGSLYPVINEVFKNCA